MVAQTAWKCWRGKGSAVIQRRATGDCPKTTPTGSQNNGNLLPHREGFLTGKLSTLAQLLSRLVSSVMVNLLRARHNAYEGIEV